MFAWSTNGAARPAISTAVLLKEGVKQLDAERLLLLHKLGVLDTPSEALDTDEEEGCLFVEPCVPFGLGFASAVRPRLQVALKTEVRRGTRQYEQSKLNMVS